MALSGCRLAASRLLEVARWQLLGKGWWCWGKGGGGKGCFQMGIILDGRCRYRIIVSSHLNNHLRQEHTMFTPHQNPTSNWLIHMARRFMSIPLPESEKIRRVKIVVLTETLPYFCLPKPHSFQLELVHADWKWNKLARLEIVLWYQTLACTSQKNTVLPNCSTSCTFQPALAIVPFLIGAKT